MASQRIPSAPVLNRRFKTSAQPIQARKDGVMQNGSLSREQRKRSSDVWCYRWWESGPTGRRIHRRIILGTIEQLHDKRAANQATVGLRREINSHDIRTKTTLMTVAELADHFPRVARQHLADYLLHQKSVYRLLDEMDCAPLGTECT